jgi:ubiquinone/menaquinone biosynthesis C-methylase UbiE
MDTAEDARQYDAMDHSVVNAQFVTDLLAALTVERTILSVTERTTDRIVRPTIEILDLGVGTGQLAIELARRAPTFHITAVDAAESMLKLARANIAAAGLADRIELVLADAKRLPFDSDSFPVVISNSIVHHIPQPRDVIAEVVRVTALGGLLFHRDLARPNDETQLQHMVATYAGDANAYQQKLFSDSLRAAITVEEMSDLVASFGFARDTVRMTSDRHWTWSAIRLP